MLHRKEWSVTVDERGRISVPASLRDVFGLKAGDTVKVILEAGELKIEPIREEEEK